MELQSFCLGISAPNFRLPNRRPFSYKSLSTSNFLSRDQRLRLGNASKLYTMPNSQSVFKGSTLLSSKRGTIACASTPGTVSNSNLSERGHFDALIGRFNGAEPFRGKSGSVSFHGLTHQLVEEGKLISSPFQEDKTSFLWVLAPVALISSLILPQFFLANLIEAFVKDEMLLEIAVSLSFDAVFYGGLGIFLLVTDYVQRPYLEFSAKRWGLITGLRGYLSSSFFTSGLKVVAPLFAIYVTWPVLGFPALVAVVPFLVGCAAQYVFGRLLQRRQSSCWPLIPIIFEVYRLYQLTKATHYIQNLMFLMKDTAVSREIIERGSALVGMVVTFQVLGVFCLWSLVTFLMRLFPSRPVAENY
ncbi:hypothetical protein SLA2020_310150 [Shorea laevis]